MLPLKAAEKAMNAKAVKDMKSMTAAMKVLIAHTGMIEKAMKTMTANKAKAMKAMKYMKTAMKALNSKKAMKAMKRTETVKDAAVAGASAGASPAVQYWHLEMQAQQRDRLRQKMQWLQGHQNRELCSDVPVEQQEQPAVAPASPRGTPATAARETWHQAWLKFERESMEIEQQALRRQQEQCRLQRERWQQERSAGLEIPLWWQQARERWQQEQPGA